MKGKKNPITKHANEKWFLFILSLDTHVYAIVFICMICVCIHPEQLLNRCRRETRRQHTATAVYCFEKRKQLTRQKKKWIIEASLHNMDSCWLHWNCSEPLHPVFNSKYIVIVVKQWVEHFQKMTKWIQCVIEKREKNVIIQINYIIQSETALSFTGYHGLGNDVKITVVWQVIALDVIIHPDSMSFDNFARVETLKIRVKSQLYQHIHTHIRYFYIEWDCKWVKISWNIDRLIHVAYLLPQNLPLVTLFLAPPINFHIKQIKSTHSNSFIATISIEINIKTKINTGNTKLLYIDYFDFVGWKKLNFSHWIL